LLGLKRRKKEISCNCRIRQKGAGTRILDSESSLSAQTFGFDLLLVLTSWDVPIFSTKLKEYVASSGTFTPVAYGQPGVNRLGQSGGSLRRPRRDSASRSTQENNSLGSSYSATRQTRSTERTSEKAASAPKQRTKKLSKKKGIKLMGNF